MSMVTAKNNSSPIPSPRLGVYPVGTAFHRSGAEIRGIGVNHWGSFVNEVTSLGVTSDYSADLTAIKQTWGLPFVRASFGMFSRSSWFSAWYQNQATYFGELDAWVAECEALGLGVIAVLAWSLRGFVEACYDIYGVVEPPKNLAYRWTKSRQLLEAYITSIVSRYKDSPAIWGWSLANETILSLGAELYYGWKLDGTGTDGGGTSLPAALNWGTKPGGGTYSPTDKMSMAEYQAFIGDMVALINSLDPHRRIITGGQPLGNSFAVKAQTTNTLAADTLAEWNGTTATENLPWMAYRDKAFPCLTGHIYPQSLSNSQFFNGGEKTQAEIIALARGWADQLNKPFLLEEWGATYHGDPVDQISTDLASETANFNAGLAAAQADAKLSAIWNYGGDLAGGSAWMRWKLSDPARTYQLEAVAAANAAMQII